MMRAATRAALHLSIPRPTLIVFFSFLFSSLLRTSCFTCSRLDHSSSALRHEATTLSLSRTGAPRKARERAVGFDTRPVVVGGLSVPSLPHLPHLIPTGPRDRAGWPSPRPQPCDHGETKELPSSAHLSAHLLFALLRLLKVRPGGSGNPSFLCVSLTRSAPAWREAQPWTLVIMVAPTRRCSSTSLPRTATAPRLSL